MKVGVNRPILESVLNSQGKTGRGYYRLIKTYSFSNVPFFSSK